jgi:tRNA dimethylallyltransferase
MRVIAIVGPTGVGKSSLGVHLADLFQGEVISADSRQVYQGLDIGAEVLRPEDMGGVPHHLIGVVPVSKVYSAADFKRDGEAFIAAISNRNKVPFVVGGTGFYTSALLEGVTLPEIPANPKLRERLEGFTTEELSLELETKDPQRWGDIDTQNRRRLIRALEIIEELGVVPKVTHTSPYDTVWIGILPPPNLKEALYERTVKQINDGLLEETKRLKETVSQERIHELGFEYQAALSVIEKSVAIEELPQLLAQKNHEYAKRQMTYFRKNKNIIWIERSDIEKAETLVREHLRKV